MHQSEVEMPGPRGLEHADLLECVERPPEIARFEVDKREPHVRRVERVENLHLIPDMVQVDDLRDVGIKSMQRSARIFGVESAGHDVSACEVVQNGPRNSRLANAAFIGADENQRRFHRFFPCLTVPRGQPRFGKGPI
jgi:hypothetical protein